MINTASRPPSSSSPHLGRVARQHTAQGLGAPDVDIGLRCSSGEAIRPLQNLHGMGRQQVRVGNRGDATMGRA